MDDNEKEIQGLEQKAEAYKQAYIECMGAIKYLKSKLDQPKEDKKKDE
tara:strand:+ start:92 stop:235 length:144 start_codon:yes stop_codon:yes gene_type:complete